MNIIFFSESNIRGKVPRDFENARTEFGWSIALDAEWCPLDESPTGMEVPRSVSELYDLGIIIIPKNMDADWVYCHNESDVDYYRGLGCKDVRVMRSLMITEGLKPRSTEGDYFKNNVKGTMIGGNFCSWYGGFDSYMVAREIGNPISAPSMGRKQNQEDMIEDISYLPYMSWREWIDTLGEFNIGVHLMRTHAAGTFSMNCSFHGIPCIGYKGLDTQEILHPLTTVEVGDLDEAKKIGKRLRDDERFYRECSETTLALYESNYTEEVWKRNWELINK